MTVRVQRWREVPLEKRKFAPDQAQQQAFDEKGTGRIPRRQLEELGLLDRQDQPADSTAPPGVDFAGEYTVTYLPIDTLHRHPKNRLASDQAVAELAASIQQHNLQQPIKVRLAGEQWGLPRGHYQIVFGERRWRAAKMAGLEQIPAHVVEIDDATALELIAVENAQREQLNPIQKAELIETLCQPVEQGGAGKTREQAGQVVGLASGSAASNLVRLLELPEIWRQRVAAGELPESFARLLLPYNHVPELLEIFDRDYRKEQKNPPHFVDDRTWQHRDKLAFDLDYLVCERTRPLCTKTKEHYGYEYFKGDWELQGHYPCLIDLTEETRAKLQIVRVPISRRQKSGKEQMVEEERALNTKLFDQLQKAAIKRHVAEKKSQGQRTTKAKAKSNRKPTAAELKRQAKERAERYARQLATWRIRWLRLMLGEELGDASAQWLLIWLATSNYYSLNWGHRQRAGDEALEIKRRDKYDSRWEPTWHVLRANVGCQFTLRSVARRFLWPAGGLDARDQENLPRELIEDLARMEQLDLEACWFALQRTAETDLRAMFEAFLKLHGKEQLEQLGRELGVNLDRARSKADMVRLFMTQAKTLPLPKCLQPAKAKAAAGKRTRSRRKK